jgi:DNA-binding MarR family transcriptional regulator
MPLTKSPCACTRVRRASRALTNLYDAELRAAGLKITQFSVLRTLQRMGPMNISALAEAMALERSALGRNLLVLKRRGLVRLGDGEDLRAWSVELTSRALHLLEGALPAWEAAQDRVRRKLGAQGVRQLFDLLEKLEEAA